MKVSQMTGAITLTWMVALAISVALGLANMAILSGSLFLLFGALTGMAKDIYD